MLRVREAEAPPIRAVREETKADAGIDEDAEKVLADRLRQTALEMTGSLEMIGRPEEIGVKENERNAEAVVHLEVTVYVHLGYRP